MVAPPAVDAAAAFDRLACLAHLLLAQARIASWSAADSEARRPIEQAFDRLRAPLVDGTLPATERERRLAGKFIEMWTPVDRLEVGWRAEAAVLLAWALELRASVLPFDQQMADVPLLVAFLDPASVAALRKRATLRTFRELETMKTTCDAWWNRARVAHELYRALAAPTSMLSKDKQLDLCGQLPEPAVLFGKPYHHLTREEHSTAYSIAAERHTAITWLWDGTPWDDLRPLP